MHAKIILMLHYKVEINLHFSYKNISLNDDDFQNPKSTEKNANLNNNDSNFE